MPIWEHGDYADFGTGLDVNIEDELNYLKNFECRGFRGDFRDINKVDGGLKQLLERSTCVYCARELAPRDRDLSKSSADQLKVSTRVCGSCGWWTLTSTKTIYSADQRVEEAYVGHITTRMAGGVLKRLNLDDVSTPLSELRKYLLARYSDRYTLNPRRFEELVGDVFSDFGYRVRVTSYSGDDGIDVAALENASGSVVGIQVKRYRNRVEAEQIRSLAGALVLGGLTKGIFVTTSQFTKGAKSTAGRFEGLGKPIELVDGARFLELLSIAQRKRVSDDHEEAIPSEVWERLADLKPMEFQTFTY